MEPTLIATVSDPSQTAELYVAGPQKKAIAAVLLLTWRYAIDPNLLVLFRGRPGQGNHGGLARAVCGVARGAELAKDAGGRYLGSCQNLFQQNVEINIGVLTILPPGFIAVLMI